MIGAYLGAALRRPYHTNPRFSLPSGSRFGSRVTDSSCSAAYRNDPCDIVFLAAEPKMCETFEGMVHSLAAKLSIWEVATTVSFPKTMFGVRIG